uniref:Peptidase_M14 domain-containing protein n=1 Tax=Macrostomum lignano TaxID=282301 RepID=A0A1I8I7F6_9PLAT
RYQLFDSRRGLSRQSIELASRRFGNWKARRCSSLSRFAGHRRAAKFQRRAVLPIEVVGWIPAFDRYYYYYHYAELITIVDVEEFSDLKADDRISGRAKLYAWSKAGRPVWSGKDISLEALPEDTLRLVYIAFLLHGVGILLPWNLFINAKEYFENYKLNTNISREADYRHNFMNYIGLGSQLPNMLMLACNVFFQPLTTSEGQEKTGSKNAARRIMLVILIEVCVCATTVIMALVDTSECPRLFFDVTLISVIVLNCCTGVYQSSAFGMAGVLPMTYSSAIVLGNNICGTVVAIVNIVSRLASSQNLQMTAVGYFSFSVVLLLICFSSLLILPKLPFYRHYQQPPSQPHSSERTCDTEQTSFESDDSTETVNGCCDENLETVRACCALCCIRKGPVAACSRYWQRYLAAFKECWVHCLSVWSTFFCTLACFPAVQSAIRPVQLLSIEAWFTDIFVFLGFNLFAMLGSLASNFVQFPKPRWLALAVWIRTLIFIPFFIMCNCFPDNRAPAFPVVIANDYVFTAGMVLFAFTGGYFSALCMMYAPRDVKNPKHAALAGMVSSFFLVSGIFCGVAFGGVLFNVGVFQRPGFGVRPLPPRTKPPSGGYKNLTHRTAFTAGNTTPIQALINIADVKNQTAEVDELLLDTCWPPVSTMSVKVNSAFASALLAFGLLLPCQLGLPTTRNQGDRLIVFVPTRQAQLDWLELIHSQAGKPGEVGENVRFWFGPGLLNQETIVFVPGGDYGRLVSAIPSSQDTYSWWTVQKENLGKLVTRETRANAVRRRSSDISSAYRTYQEILNFLDQTQSTCGSFCSVEKFGTSYEGRDLKLIKIGDDLPSKRIIWIDAGIHAREWIAPATALYFIDKIVQGYKSSDSTIKSMLDNFAFYIAPLLNPDGYVYTFTTNRFWRKTRSAQAGGCYGVDPNRNFGYHWGGQGTSSNPCAETFRGSSAFSEPETRAVRDKLLAIRLRTISFITMHSYGQDWMVPYGYAYNVSVDNYAQMMRPVQAAADKLKSLGRNYDIGNSAVVTYPAAGASDDYAASIGVPYAHTIELPDTGQYGFLLPQSEIPRVGLETLEALKVYLGEAADFGLGSRLAEVDRNFLATAPELCRCSVLRRRHRPVVAAPIGMLPMLLLLHQLEPPIEVVGWIPAFDRYYYYYHYAELITIVDVEEFSDLKADDRISGRAKLYAWSKAGAACLVWQGHLARGSARKLRPPLRDTLRLVYIAFLLHGVGILLPWNLFINAKEYFENYKLNTNISREADYRHNFMNYIGLGSQLPNMLMLACNVFFQPLTTSEGQEKTGSKNAARRIMLVILIEVCVCATTVIMALVDTSECPRLFFDVTLISVIVLNCCTGVYQSSAFGMAGVLPMTYSSAIVLGNNICGTVVAIVNIVSRLASSQNLQMTAVGYFSFSVVLLLICFSSLLILPKLPFYRHYQQPPSQPHSSERTCDTEQTSFESDDSTETVNGCCDENLETVRACCALCCIRKGPVAACSRYWQRYLAAFKECWVHCLSVWSTFFCTLACFPAVQSAIRPVQLLSIEAWFTDIFVFLGFNLFAMLGSLASNFVQFPKPRWLALAVWIRTLIFIPFFIMCNCFPDNRAPAFPVVIANDYVFTAGMVLFAFTGGYFSALCMMYAPRDVKNPKHAALAGMVSSFFLVSGIFCGVAFGGVLFNVGVFQRPGFGVRPLPPRTKPPSGGYKNLTHRTAFTAGNTTPIQALINIADVKNQTAEVDELLLDTCWPPVSTMSVKVNSAFASALLAFGLLLPCQLGLPTTRNQ